MEPVGRVSINQFSSDNAKNKKVKFYTKNI